MSKAIFDMSISLDGFVRAANATPEEPLGDEHIQLETVEMIETDAATHMRFRIVF